MDKELLRKEQREAEAGYKALIASAADVLSGVLGGGGGGVSLSAAQLYSLRAETEAYFQRFDVPLILQALQLIRVSKNYYNYHAVNVALLSLIIAQMLGLDDARRNRLTTIGLCCDFGMLRLPLNILQGTGKLTEQEFGRVKNHPNTTEMILERAGIHDDAILTAVRYHHERWDGSGYPDGLSGEAIPEDSRIITIADWYDAANAKRDYKKSKSPFDVLAELQGAAGQALDPRITKIAVKGIANILQGRFVLLSDNSVGRVATVDLDNLRYPDVIVVGRRVKTGPDLYPVSLSGYIPLF